MAAERPGVNPCVVKYQNLHEEKRFGKCMIEAVTKGQAITKKKQLYGECRYKPFRGNHISLEEYIGFFKPSRKENSREKEYI